LQQHIDGTIDTSRTQCIPSPKQPGQLLNRASLPQYNNPTIQRTMTAVQLMPHWHAATGCRCSASDSCRLQLFALQSKASGDASLGFKKLKAQGSPSAPCWPDQRDRAGHLLSRCVATRWTVTFTTECLCQKTASLRLATACDSNKHCCSAWQAAIRYAA
jgi:hypothetical protein